MDDKVIVLKDWVPGWVRDSYLTNEEIDALNDEYYRSQSTQENVETSPGTQALLVEKLRQSWKLSTERAWKGGCTASRLHC